MKSSKRFISLLTAVVMTAFAFGGCAQAPAPDTQDTEASVTSEVSSDTTAEKAETSGTAAPVTEKTENVPLANDMERNDIIESVTADSMKGMLASADTSFTVKLREDMEESDLKPLLTLSEDGGFTLQKTADRTFVLKPSKKLRTNSIASVGLVNKNGEIIYRWAFQTECELKVDEVYPAPESTYVSLDTGIEFTFTCPVSAEEARKSISITPKTDGRFEAHGNTVYFIPSKNLKARTNYYVTIAKGLLSADGMELEESYMYYFSTNSSTGDTYFYTSDISETFLEGDLPVIEVYGSSDIISKKCSLKLYRYPDAQAYKNSLLDLVKSGRPAGDYEFSSNGLECVYSNDRTEIMSTEDSWKASYIMLPEILEEGGYLAEVRTSGAGADFLIQRHIQICPVSVYAATLSGNAVFFINDTVSGNTCSGASVTLITEKEQYTASADRDGVASVQLKEEKDGRALLTVAAGSSVYSDIFEFRGETETDPRDEYYMYLYTDREAYLPTDTINVWGVIRPRRAGVPVPDELTLALGRYSWEIGIDTLGTAVPVTLMPDGTFTAKLSLVDHEDTWWCDLMLMSGDRKLTSKSVSVHEYEKPIYVLDTEMPDIAVSPQTNPVKADISVTLYDETPAEGVPVKASSYLLEEECTAVTDKDGKASVSLLFNDVDSWRPYTMGVSTSITGIENVYVYRYGNVVGFFRDRMLEYDFDKDAKTLGFTLSEIRPEAYRDHLDDDIYYYDDYSFLRGAPADGEVSVTLIRNWTEKTENGTYYDFLQKKTVKKYSYDYKEETVKKYKVSISNGKGLITDLPVNDKNSSYRIETSWKDSQGRETSDTYYLGTRDYYYSYDTVYRYYSIQPEKDVFKENEELGFTLTRNGDDASDEKGRVLLQLYCNDIISSTVYETTSFKHKMTKDYIPDVMVCGAYFDGRHIYPINTYYELISYDYAERELDVSISSDKEKYSPAENVSVKVSVKDGSGLAVNGASVIISVVDEAAFAVVQQYADPLSDIYQYIWADWITQYHSYVQHTLDTNGAGEKGGGGDEDSIRKDFLDTALFYPATTGSDGTCTASFKLPDNITKWRVTAIAVKETKTDYVYAGVSKSPVIATKEMFLSPVMLNEYVEGDDIAVTSKLFGGDGSTNIEFTLTGGGQNKTVTAHRNETANFGKLPAGEYTVRFKAQSGGNSDIVEMPLIVSDSLLEIPVTQELSFEEAAEISPQKWPVYVTFYNEDYKLYADTVFRLCRCPGGRLDMRIAEYFALKEMEFITEEDYLYEFNGIADSGLAKLMKDSEESPELTALIAAAAPELLNRNSVSRRFNKIISDPKSTHRDVASAYMGLGALGKPVITSVKNILESDAKGFDTADKLRLCAALALAGDYDSAEKYFRETADIVTEGDKAYIKDDKDLLMTQNALVTASVLRLPEADMMARFLLGEEEKFESYSLEMMVFLRNYRASADSRAAFTYQHDGKTETVEIDRIFGTNIKLFGKPDLTLTEGRICAVARYTGRREDTGSTGLKITKTLSAENGKFAVGELVTVNIKVSGEKGRWCMVYDVIPSCGRYDGGCFRNMGGQRVRLMTDSNGNASYTFRLATSGEYVLESAAASDGKGYAFSERTTVSVQDKR